MNLRINHNVRLIQITQPGGKFWRLEVNGEKMPGGVIAKDEISGLFPSDQENSLEMSRRLDLYRILFDSWIDAAFDRPHGLPGPGWELLGEVKEVFRIKLDSTPYHSRRKSPAFRRTLQVLHLQAERLAAMIQLAEVTGELAELPDIITEDLQAPVYHPRKPKAKLNPDNGLLAGIPALL